MSEKTELPRQVEEWTRDHVHYWLTKVIQVDVKHADTLYQEEVSGKELICYQSKDLQELGIKHGPAVRMITRFNELKRHEKGSNVSLPSTNSKGKSQKKSKSEYGEDSMEKPTNLEDPSMDNTADKLCKIEEHMRAQGSCSLFPFDQSSASHRYIKNYTLPPETGPGNLIDPVHEYKFMGGTDDIDVMKKKFNKEVFRFAAGCMNARTNGTIHFGVADSRGTEYAHGEIIGVRIENRDTLIDHFNQGIKSHFENHTDEAKACIRQPRFVEVLSPDGKLSGKYIIEVDVVPSHSVVHDKLFFIKTLNDNQGKKIKEYSLFLRDGAATPDFYDTTNPNQLLSKIARITNLDNLRLEAENRFKNERLSNQGETLKKLLTFGEGLGDYIIVTNKSHPEQLQHLLFMTTLNILCVLDFDSAESGSYKKYMKDRVANLYEPSKFLKDVGNNLNLNQKNSWVFCNGREGPNSEYDRPLEPTDWFTKKAVTVQDIISFLCNSSTVQRKKLLVVFLLLSTVEDQSDPMIDTYMQFYKHLGGSHISSICPGNASFQKWKDIIQARCKYDISPQSIYELELSEINGTILKLGQNNIKRLLASVERSSVVLRRKDEDIMTSLDVLCVNECENIPDISSAAFEQFKNTTESEFYRGGRVKWWNFYFSELRTAKPFIKRDKYTSLKHTIESRARDSRNTCVVVKLFHQPCCGGTTMAMHVMWNLRHEFRCAVLKDNTVSKEDVARHVAHLIKCGKNEQSFKTPVLLLVEDAEETENTQTLHDSLRNITGETGAVVIILNCIRTNHPEDRYRENVMNSVFIKATLTDREKHAFKEKLKELQEIESFTTENFYGFTILKSSFDPQLYVTDVVSNVLRDFNAETKEAQLLYILALMNSCVTKPAVPYFLCADFLGIESALWGTESVLEKMEPYSCLLIECRAEEYGGVNAISFVNQYFATECLKQLKNTHNFSWADIVLDVLHSDSFNTFVGVRVFFNLLERIPVHQRDKLTHLIDSILSTEDGRNKMNQIIHLILNARDVIERYS